MKNTIIALLVSILLVVIANLLLGLGLFGGGGGKRAGYEYRVLDFIQMDKIGFLSVAAEQGWEVSEDAEAAYFAEPSPENLAKWLGVEVSGEGVITFPEAMRKFNLLARTITEVEKDGGWEFVSVTGDNHYVFRRAK